MAQAKQYERDRDIAMSRYHNYELASAAYQIGIVLASAAVITGMIVLAYGAAALGIIGLCFHRTSDCSCPNVPHDVLHWGAHFFEGGPSAAPAH